MPISNSLHPASPLRIERAAFAALFALGVLVFGAAHLLFLADVPGLHFDEAWSANLAADIAGGGPWRAQSAYTRPWAQYLAGFAFELFGTNLFAFRLVQVCSSMLGVALLGLAVWRAGFKKATLALPLAAFALPGLTANHRFAIEITGFHALAFGALILGLELRARKGPRQGAYFLMGAGAILGTTAHILFLAPLLGLFAAVVLSGTALLRSDRLFLLFLSLVLTPFFLAVAYQVPEQGKGWLLVVFGIALFLWAALGARIPEWVREHEKRIVLALGIAALPFLFNAVVFADGHWTYLLTHGGLFIPYFAGLAAILAFLVVYRAWKNATAPPAARFWLRLTIFTTLASGALMLKAAPRYFEVPLLLIAVTYAYGIAAFDPRRALVLGGLIAVLVGGLFWVNYLVPGRYGYSREREVKFLAFKDSSRDFLPKQALVGALAVRGCRLQNVRTNDSRVEEALRFLARGDWQIPDGAPACPGVRVERVMGESAGEAEKANAHSAANVGDFLVWSEN